VPRFRRPLFHDNFEDHQAAAGRRVVTQEEAEDVWFARREFYANTKRRGSYLMRGLTPAGRSITVVILPTADPETWLLFTAW